MAIQWGMLSCGKRSAKDRYDLKPTQGNFVHSLNAQIFGEAGVLRSAIIFFCLSEEIVSCYDRC